jgi:hypothetical protein
MPRQGRIYDIFLSSPSDVEKERQIVERVVNKLNRELTKNNLSLNLMRWESSAFSGIGPGAQEVVDRALYHRYDLYIGILWHRFGSATEKFGSGTEQEFTRALDRYREGDPNIDITFFIRKSPLPNEVEPAQYEKVLQFQKRLREYKVLPKEFVSLKQFEDEVTRHIREYALRPVWGDDASTGSLDAAGADPASATTGHLRALVTALGRATQELHAELAPLSKPSAMAADHAGLILNNARRRLDIFYQEVKDISGRLAADMRELAANWVLQPEKRTALREQLRTVEAEAEQAVAILEDLVLKTGRAGSMLSPVLVEIFERHARLGRYAQEGAEKTQRQVALLTALGPVPAAGERSARTKHPAPSTA